MTNVFFDLLTYLTNSRCIESERQYDASRFNHRVCTDFSFEDHNPPTIKMILAFCQHVQTRISSMSDQTIVIHCKAGKVCRDKNQRHIDFFVVIILRVEQVL